MIPVKVILSWAIDNVYLLNHKIFWLYTKSLITDIQKSLCQSLKRSSITTFTCINTFYSMTQDLAAEIHQEWPLLDQKMRILWHKTLFLLELLNLKMVSPGNSLKHIWKPKRVRYHLKHHNITWGKIIIFSFVALLIVMNLTQSISSEKLMKALHAHHRGWPQPIWIC